MAPLSTLNAVQGLLAYERLTGDDPVRNARRGGEEYLLERGWRVGAAPASTNVVTPASKA